MSKANLKLPYQIAVFGNSLCAIYSVTVGIYCFIEPMKKLSLHAASSYRHKFVKLILIEFPA
jgi:hypothetical protein